MLQFVRLSCPFPPTS